MITFYPRDIGMWRNIYLFNQHGNPSSLFYDREHFLTFLNENLKFSKTPIEFIGPITHHVFGPNIYVVRPVIVIGWIHDSDLELEQIPSTTQFFESIKK